MSDEDVMDINSEFHELIDEKYLIDYPNSKKSEQIIVNCFKDVKYDRNKLEIVSLIKKLLNNRTN